MPEQYLHHEGLVWPIYRQFFSPDGTEIAVRTIHFRLSRQLGFLGQDDGKLFPSLLWVTDKSVSQRFSGFCFVVLRSFNFRVFSVTFVLCFEMNAGPSTVLELTRPAKRNAMRDIGIESCSEGQSSISDFLTGWAYYLCGLTWNICNHNAMKRSSPYLCGCVC